MFGSNSSQVLHLQLQLALRRIPQQLEEVLNLLKAWSPQQVRAGVLMLSYEPLPL